MNENKNWKKRIFLIGTSSFWGALMLFVLIKFGMVWLDDGAQTVEQAAEETPATYDRIGFDPQYGNLMAVAGERPIHGPDLELEYDGGAADDVPDARVAVRTQIEPTGGGGSTTTYGQLALLEPNGSGFSGTSGGSISPRRGSLQPSAQRGGGGGGFGGTGGGGGSGGTSSQGDEASNTTDPAPAQTTDGTGAPGGQTDGGPGGDEQLTELTDPSAPGTTEGPTQSSPPSRPGTGGDTGGDTGGRDTSGGGGGGGGGTPDTTATTTPGGGGGGGGGSGGGGSGGGGDGPEQTYDPPETEIVREVIEDYDPKDPENPTYDGPVAQNEDNSQVPEPGTLVLFAIALVSLGFLVSRRREA